MRNQNERKNESNEIRDKKAQLQLKELCRYYQDQDYNRLLEDISPSKRKKFLEKIKKNQKKKYNNMKIRYNQQSSNNEEESESIEKNNTCPRLNNFTPNKKINYKYPNEYYYNILSNDFNDNNNIINKYNNKENPNSTHSKQKLYKSNSDYDGDNNIFTRIVPNFEDDKNNNSSIPCENYILYNNKTYDVHKKKLPKNSSFIYCKSKTPTKKCVYHRKKKKNNLYENEIISINSEADSNLYNNNGSASNDYDNFSIDSKKLQLILDSGVNFDMKDKKNDYIDLLTISDIKNMEKQKKLKKKKNMQNILYSDNKKKDINVANYAVVPNAAVSSPTNTNTSYESTETYNQEENSIIRYPKRNNHFLSKKHENIKERKNGYRDDNNKSYDCIVFKKKLGIKHKKKKKVKRNKTSDIYGDDRGTPIKKENDRGGIVVLYNKLKNYNPKNKSLKNNDKNMIYTITTAITIIDKWWKKVTYKYFKEVVEIIITKKFKTFKKNKPTILYISKEYYKLPIKEIILIQNKFNVYIKFKNNKNLELSNYRPKETCYKPEEILSQTNNSPSPDKFDTITSKKNNNMNVRKIKNNLNVIKSKDNNKGHIYTDSKLFQSDISTILLSNNEIRYNTKNYTYLKRCHYRRRSNSDQEEDDENGELNRRPFTCEIMRKIKFKPDKGETKRYIRRHNPNLKIVKSADTQYLTNKRKKKKKLKKNNDNKSDKIKKINNEQKNNDEKNKVNDNIKKNDDNNSIKENSAFNNYKISYVNYNKNENNNAKYSNANDENLENGGTLNSNYNIHNKAQDLNKYKNKIDDNDKNQKNYNNYNYYNSNEKDLKDNNYKNSIKDYSSPDNNINNYSKNNDIHTINSSLNSYNNNKKDNKNYNNHTIKTIRPDKKDNFNNNNVNNYSYKYINDRNSNKYNSNNSKENNNHKNINRNDNIDNNRIYNSKYSNNKNQIQNINKITNYKPIELTKCKENEITIEKNLPKIILIQRNVRIFIEKIKPKIKNAKKTYLQNNIKDNKQINNFSYSFQPKYYNNNAVYINNDNKTNLSRAELRENGKNSNNINRSIYNNSNLEYSISEQGKNKNNNENKKNNDTDSLKTISLNMDNLMENNKINDSPINNSLLKVNSINSINNNIKKYINNPPSNFNSFAENSRTNTLKDERNSKIPPDSETKRRQTSSSLKSLQYRYNKTSFKEYFNFLLKDNYMKYAISQINYIARHIKYYNLVYMLKMLVQRIIKIMHQFVFYVLKGEGFVVFKNVFFNIIKTYVKNKDLYVNYNNDVSKLLNNTILYYHKIYNKYNLIPYIKPDDEEKLIQTELFNNDINYNNLISFIGEYLNIEKNTDNFSPELIRYYLNKRPLKNYNIFGITRYINSLHYIIIYNPIKSNEIVIKDLTKDKISKRFDDNIKKQNLKSNNTKYNDINHRNSSLDDNKSFNLSKINTVYTMKENINGERNDDIGKSTNDEAYLRNLKNNGSSVNKEIVSKIYEDNNNNVNERSSNYEKDDNFEMKRNIERQNSPNIKSDSVGKVRPPNNSLIKKNFINLKNE